ncbi:hypothetical protein ACFPRL_27545 [Pseudoclavibacter helvolus]
MSSVRSGAPGKAVTLSGRVLESLARRASSRNSCPPSSPPPASIARASMSSVSSARLPLMRSETYPVLRPSLAAICLPVTLFSAMNPR